MPGCAALLCRKSPIYVFLESSLKKEAKIIGNLMGTKDFLKETLMLVDTILPIPELDF